MPVWAKTFCWHEDHALHKDEVKRMLDFTVLNSNESVILGTVASGPHYPSSDPSRNRRWVER
jgi:hypothetical protein